MTHKFELQQKQKLDTPERRKTLPPKKLLEHFGIKAGDRLADIGCGIGYFTLPAARIVGKQGKVYALDIEQEMLAEIEKKLLSDSLTNVELVQVKLNHLVLSNSTASCALAAFILHEVNPLEVFLAELRRILQPAGRLYIIEWDKKKTLDGPPEKARIDCKTLEALLAQAGFGVVEDFKVNEDMYAIVAEKK